MTAATEAPPAGAYDSEVVVQYASGGPRRFRVRRSFDLMRRIEEAFGPMRRLEQALRREEVTAADLQRLYLVVLADQGQNTPSEGAVAHHIEVSGIIGASDIMAEVLAALYLGTSRWQKLLEREAALDAEGGDDAPARPPETTSPGTS